MLSTGHVQNFVTFLLVLSDVIKVIRHCPCGRESLLCILVHFGYGACDIISIWLILKFINLN